MTLPVGTYSPDGTVDIVDTDYEIPGSNVYYVATNGSDSANGTSTSTPWLTIGHACSTAPTGSTIVIRGGTYREGSLTLNKQITFQSYPHEKVWLKGSVVVSSWVADGTTWRSDGWTHQFAVDASPDQIDAAYPMAGHADMVYIDGQSLTQVGSLVQVVAGTFYVDYANSRLYIGSDPTGKTVEAAAQPLGINFDGSGASGSKVLGLGFLHYATGATWTSSAPMRAHLANDVVFENNTAAWNSVGGVAVFDSTGNVIRGNTFAFNGQQGVCGNNAGNLLLEDNAIAYNNIEHFVANYSAGGSKLTNCVVGIARGNLTDHNYCDGLWWDIDCYDITIVNNTCLHDSRIGIEYEISYGNTIIASNLVVGSEIGIKVGSGSSDVKVYNNTLVSNRSAFEVWQDDRPYMSANLTIRNNIFSNAQSGYQLVNILGYIYTGEQLGVSMDYDAYYRASSSSPSVLVRWANGSGQLTYNTLAAFQSGEGQETGGLTIDNVATNPFFVDEAGGDYRLVAGSPAIGAGTPLPSDVAAALGLTAGVPVDLGMLTLGVPTPPSANIYINVGGSLVAPFGEDAYFTGGTTSSTTDSINTSGVIDPAPEAVYRTDRLGDFTYAIPTLTIGARYQVRLHFAEFLKTAAGQRTFDVAINGIGVLSGFDIYSAAGGKDIAIVQQFNTIAVGNTASGDVNTDTGVGEGAAQGFDGNSATKWTTLAGSGWLQYQFGGGAAHVVTQYGLTVASDTGAYPTRAPRDWTFLGSHDGSTWDTLDTQTGQSDTVAGHTTTYTIANTTAYEYYRLNITANNGDTGATQLADLELMEAVGDPTLFDCATGGTASGDVNTNTGNNEGAAQGFDGNLATKWTTLSTSGWLQYHFGVGVSHVVTQYGLTVAEDTSFYTTRAPKNWTFLGSHNGSTWDTLDTQANQSDTVSGHTQLYSIANTTAYEYYRLNITANNGAAATQLAELKLMAFGAPTLSDCVSGDGIISIQFTSVVDNAKVDGIEIHVVDQSITRRRSSSGFPSEDPLE